NAQATGSASISLGANNNVSGAGAGAFGGGNTVSNSNTFVLGSNVTSSQDNSVILGNNSTDGAVHTGTTAKQITFGSTTHNYAGLASANAGMVSVGRSDAERQIQYVAAGDVTASSTDAINGSQLYA